MLSVVWSSTPILESLKYLSEYRIYLIVPVFISALALSEQTRHLAFISAMLGALGALVASYGLELGWWEVEGANRSLGNRIYHGFIMSCFLLACLLIARESNGVVRLIAASVAMLVVYNVLNIEVGRTGYLQIIFVCLTFAVLSFSINRAGLVIGVAGILFVISYLSFEQFSARINSTVVDVENYFVNDDHESSAGQRLEFYRGAINIGLDDPWTGVGVGEVTKTLKSSAEKGQIRILTDNVHNEFLNMLMAGGIPAFLLFIGFVLSIAYSGYSVRRRSRWLGDALIGLGMILLVSALFNSTIKDYGEKHALIIILSILGAHLSASRARLIGT